MLEEPFDFMVDSAIQFDFMVDSAIAFSND